MIKFSRFSLEKFINCPRCFYLEKKLELKPMSMVPLTLAIATDALLKNEFDQVRSSGAIHPLWTREGLNVKAFSHPDIDDWRNNKKGIQFDIDNTYLIYGSVDDIWQGADGKLHIVDYKSTSKKDTPTLSGDFGEGYKRQMEIYQWLFRKNGFEVDEVGYFLYVNGSKAGGFYDSSLVGHMHFETTLISYSGDDSWVEKCIADAISCYESNNIPPFGDKCDTCRYVKDRKVYNAD